MTSYSGSIAYLKYVALSSKGGVNIGDEFNSVFAQGKMTDARVQYTSQVIVEAVTKGTTSVTTGMEIIDGGIKHEDNMAIIASDVKCIAEDGTVSYATKATATTVTVPATTVKIAYVGKTYQMEKVPAEDIPTIGPKMEHIALVAEPRRIAVRYDQITAYQAKTDYGFSLDKQIAKY